MAGPEDGSITWLEIPVVSVTRAATFYADVLGWECDATAAIPTSLPGIKSMYMFKKGTPVHGCFLEVEKQEDMVVAAAAGKAGNIGVVATFRVQSIEETLARVEKAGGVLHVSKTDIGGNNGFFARFVDTEGNLQSLWSQN